jgi:hypothetical protein
MTGSIPGPAALFVAHPGHELRVHGWLETARPSVFVLTDGAGPAGAPRLDSTRTVIGQAGARTGSVFGHLTDRAAYTAVMAGDATPFVEVARELAAFLVSERIETVVGDAREGYNPIHDVARSVIDAAVRMAAHRSHLVRNLDFNVVGPAEDESDPALPGRVRLELDETALARKLAAARGFRQMDAEVRSSLARWGPSAFGVECLRPVFPATSPVPGGPPPFYEQYGEARVGAGVYARVLRYAEHVLPVVRILERQAEA